MRARKHNLKIKRIYDPPEESDGYRVLVDRLWPRGVAKDKAHIDLWLKDIAPSNELRKWFAHDPAKWNGFKQRYLEELKANDTAVEVLKSHLAKGDVTLLYAARDREHNEAVVLRDNLVKL